MKSDFKFHHPLRVRFAEADLQGFVFNANYLMYCDVAWTEYFRAIGLSYTEMAQTGIDSVLKKTTLEFDAPARFDDLLGVYARVSRIGQSSVSFDFEIYIDNNEVLVASASSVYVFIDTETHQPTNIPEFLRLKIRDFEGKDFF